MMEIRNAVQAAMPGVIDCEINHDQLGWIPFSASASDTEGLGPEVWQALQVETVAAADPVGVRRAGYVVVCDAIANAASAFTQDLPPETIAAWATKAAAARAFLSGTVNPSITAEAEVAGIDPELLVSRILAKADIYETTIARLDGLRSAAWYGLLDVDTPEAVSSVVEDMLVRLDAIVAAVPSV